MNYSDKPLLDKEILAENTMNSVQLQQELFVLFFEQGDLYLSQLDEALRDGDVEAWRMTAHGVKGASRSLGFTRLASVASDAERSSPDADRLAKLGTIMADTRGAVWPRENAA